MEVHVKETIRKKTNYIFLRLTTIILDSIPVPPLHTSIAQHADLYADSVYGRAQPEGHFQTDMGI